MDGVLYLSQGSPSWDTMPDETSNRSSEARLITWLLVALSAVYFLPLIIIIAEYHLFGTHRFDQLCGRLGLKPTLELMYDPLIHLIDRIL